MFDPERLSLARTRRGLKKSQLARLVGKAPRTITEYENGTSEPQTPTVTRLAQVLRFPEQFFYEPLGDTVPVGGASFRALSRMTATQRDAALAVGTFGMILNEWIESEFHLPEVVVPDLQPGIINPEGAAAFVRSQWGLGDAPIQNMLHLLEAHGVRVFSLTDECREVDAFSFWNRSVPYVCLATYKSAERSIFDAAHELGHLVLHRNHAAPRGRVEEHEADMFASNFLMPRSDVLAVAPRNPTFAQLAAAKTRWRVSAAALNYRLHRLGSISDWHYRELCIEISRLGRNVEPNPLPREQSQVLSKVFAALKEDGVSRRDLAAKFCWYQPDLDAITFGLSMTLIEGDGQDSGTIERPPLRLV